MTVAAIISFLVILTVLVFVHEMGHYWIARRNGVRVEVFSIGFGPELFGWEDEAKTRWKICAIPLGGYVKMFGDSDAASTKSSESISFTPQEISMSFHHKRLSQRAAIVSAGPAANFLFAIILLTMLYSMVGQRYAAPIIDSLVAGSAADQAGLMVGDKIVSVDDVNISKFDELKRIVAPNPNKKMSFIILRDNKKLAFDVMPRLVERKDASGAIIRIGLLGVGSEKTSIIRHNPIAAFRIAVQETWSTTLQTVEYLGQMIAGSRSAEELGGPIRIAKISGAVTELGLASTLYFMAVLSINLGLINLFPIPILDGGHLFFYFLEFIRGRPLGAKAHEIASVAGLGVVIALMVFVTLNDIWPNFWSGSGFS